MALLPPFLRNLMNYPVVTTGMLPRRARPGTLIAMMLVGRLLARPTRAFSLRWHEPDGILAMADGALERAFRKPRSFGAA